MAKRVTDGRTPMSEDQLALAIRAYRMTDVALDALPYTEAFEAIYRHYQRHGGWHDRHGFWRGLAACRKAGKLQRKGR